LKALGVTADDKLLRELAKSACEISPNAHKMPFKVTPELLYDAIQLVESR
jgi:hypothetical protein